MKNKVMVLFIGTSVPVTISYTHQEANVALWGMDRHTTADEVVIKASRQSDSSYKRKQENTHGTTTNTSQVMFIWKMDSHALLWRCWQCYLLIGMAISAPLSGAPQTTLLGHSKPPHHLPSEIHPPGNPERNYSYFVLCIRLSFIFTFLFEFHKFKIFKFFIISCDIVKWIPTYQVKCHYEYFSTKKLKKIFMSAVKVFLINSVSKYWRNKAFIKCKIFNVNIL